MNKDENEKLSAFRALLKYLDKNPIEATIISIGIAGSLIAAAIGCNASKINEIVNILIR